MTKKSIAEKAVEIHSKKPAPRTEYSPRVRVTAQKGGPSLTQQSFKKDCDINSILARHQAGDILTHVNPAQPHYGEANPLDYRQAMTLVAQVKQEFMALPGTERAAYQNNPELYLADLERKAEELRANPEDAPPSASVSAEPGIGGTNPESPRPTVPAGAHSEEGGNASAASAPPTQNT